MRSAFTGCLLWLAASAQAHPVTSTLAEAHWRAASVEVALTVPTHDLVEALARRGEDLFGADGEAAAGRYLASRFQVATLAGPVALRFVGLETGPTESTLYFEVPVREGAGVTVRHAVFFELSPAQVNTLVVHRGTPEVRWSLVFHASTPVLPLLPPPLPPGNQSPGHGAAGP